MRARTVEELSYYLRDDLAWRRKEIRVLQSIVRGSEASKKQAILRGAIAALYAHWEGFVKTACRIFLEFVRLRRLRHRELSIAFLGLAFRLRLESTEGGGRLDSHRDFSDWLLREWDGRAKLPSPDDLFGTSNLTSDVFKSFIKGLGLPYDSDFERAEKPVIDALVQLRNHLAHGAWVPVDEGKYDELVIWIDRLIQRVCDFVEDAAATGTYRRALQQLV
jgi:hypothetical protein